jgi:hypothetical protein
MLVHRIVRAPEKRIFYINVGAIPPAEIENFMQKDYLKNEAYSLCRSTNRGL